MDIIVITDPDFLPGEAEIIMRLLDEGAYRVHVRKPAADTRSTAHLIEELPAGYRSRLSLHDHHSIATCLGIGGIHLNSRNPQPPESFSGLISRSCHSLEEIRKYRDECSYMFLSPVFDSISKEGYRSAFSMEDLRKSGISLHNVFALGGISPDNAALAASTGFGGVSVLGWLWQQYRHDHDADALLERFRCLFFLQSCQELNRFCQMA